MAGCCLPFGELRGGSRMEGERQDGTSQSGCLLSPPRPGTLGPRPPSRAPPRATDMKCSRRADLPGFNLQGQPCKNPGLMELSRRPSQPSATRPRPVWMRKQLHDTCLVGDLIVPGRRGITAKSGCFKPERKEGKPKKTPKHTDTFILKNWKTPTSPEITREALRIAVPLKALLS